MSRGGKRLEALETGRQGAPVRIVLLVDGDGDCDAALAAEKLERGLAPDADVDVIFLRSGVPR